MQKEKSTKNGLKVVTSPMPAMNSISMGVWIGVGGRYESARQSGISHYAEHMLFKGTNSRSTKGLKEAIEGVGGSFNGFTSDEVTCYMVKVPAKYMDLGVEILSDMVLDPKFDKGDLEREKSVICEEIKMYQDQPADHVMELLGEIVWPDNPLGRPLTGTVKTVKSFTRDEIIRFKEESYHPGNMAFIVAGNAKPEKVFESVNKRFSHCKKKKNLSFEPPKLNQKAPKLKIVKGDSSQTHIAFGFPIKDKDKRERFAIKLMNVILGGNMSSRLFEELREKYGLCYDISSSYKRHSDIGEVNIHAGVDPKKAIKSVTAILDELKKIRDMGVTEDELERAKEFAKGQTLLSLEGTSTRMLWLGDRLMVHNNIPDIKEILKNVDRVTCKDISCACESIFNSSNTNLAMISSLSAKDRNRIRKEVDKL